MATQPQKQNDSTQASPANEQRGAKKFGNPPSPAEIANTIKSNGGTVSAAIRTMFAAGMSRSEIAHKLQKRYQHVRNVLITPVKSQRTADGATAVPQGEQQAAVAKK
jgi:ribosome-binding protein aMBF1 (putative translation factor)